MSQGSTKGVPIDTDAAMAADSDTVVPSQKAVRAYVANQTPTVDVVSNVTGPTILGKVTGSGNSEELTAAQVRALLGDPWVTITDSTLGAPAADFVVTVTGYNDLEVLLTGYGTNLTNAVGMRVQFNGDGASNYLNNGGAATTAWNNVGSVPGSLTNTNRSGIWAANISLGHTSRDTVATYRSAYRASDSATGTAGVQGGAYYTNLSAAITSMRIFPSAGNWATGTRLLVRGRV